MTIPLRPQSARRPQVTLNLRQATGPRTLPVGPGLITSMRPYAQFGALEACGEKQEALV